MGSNKSTPCKSESTPECSVCGKAFTVQNESQQTLPNVCSLNCSEVLRSKNCTSHGQTSNVPAKTDTQLTAVEVCSTSPNVAEENQTVLEKMDATDIVSVPAADFTPAYQSVEHMAGNGVQSLPNCLASDFVNQVMKNNARQELKGKTGENQIEEKENEATMHEDKDLRKILPPPVKPKPPKNSKPLSKELRMNQPELKQANPKKMDKPELQNETQQQKLIKSLKKELVEARNIPQVLTVEEYRKEEEQRSLMQTEESQKLKGLQKILNKNARKELKEEKIIEHPQQLEEQPTEELEAKQQPHQRRTEENEGQNELLEKLRWRQTSEQEDPKGMEFEEKLEEQRKTRPKEKVPSGQQELQEKLNKRLRIEVEGRKGVNLEQQVEGYRKKMHEVKKDHYEEQSELQKKLSQRLSKVCEILKVNERQKKNLEDTQPSYPTQTDGSEHEKKVWETLDKSQREFEVKQGKENKQLKEKDEHEGEQLKQTTSVKSKCFPTKSRFVENDCSPKVKEKREEHCEQQHTENAFVKNQTTELGVKHEEEQLLKIKSMQKPEVKQRIYEEELEEQQQRLEEQRRKKLDEQQGLREQRVKELDEQPKLQEQRMEERELQQRRQEWERKEFERQQKLDEQRRKELEEQRREEQRREELVKQLKLEEQSSKELEEQLKLKKQKRKKLEEQLKLEEQRSKGLKEQQKRKEQRNDEREQQQRLEEQTRKELEEEQSSDEQTRKGVEQLERVKGNQKEQSSELKRRESLKRKLQTEQRMEQEKIQRERKNIKEQENVQQQRLQEQVTINLEDHRRKELEAKERSELSDNYRIDNRNKEHKKQQFKPASPRSLAEYSEIGFCAQELHKIPEEPEKEQLSMNQPEIPQYKMTESKNSKSSEWTTYFKRLFKISSTPSNLKRSNSVTLRELPLRRSPSLSSLQQYSSTEIAQSTNNAASPAKINFKLAKLKSLHVRYKEWKFTQLPIDVLWLTVEDDEFLACYCYLESAFRSYHSEIGDVYFGEIGDGKEKVRNALLRLFGSIKPESAIDCLKPRIVFSVGFCGGLRKKNTKLGDVVVASKLLIYGYENPKYYQLWYGNELNVSQDVRVFIKSAHSGWRAPLRDRKASRLITVHRDVTVLTGPELTDGTWEPKVFRKQFPEAMAVEEEDEGVYAAASGREIDFVIVKGISHYVDDSDCVTNHWKQFASVMAASLVTHLLRDPRRLRKFPHYQEKEKDCVNDVYEGDRRMKDFVPGIQDLNLHRRSKICKKLNVKEECGGDYRELAAYFNMHNDVLEAISRESNPTDALLRWAARKYEIVDLRKNLVNMGRLDCVKILDG